MLPVSMQRGIQNIRGLLQAVSAEQTSPIFSRARDDPSGYSARQDGRRSSIPPSCTGEELPQEEASCCWRCRRPRFGGLGAGFRVLFCSLLNAEKEKQQSKWGAICCFFTWLLLGQYNKSLLLSAVKLTHFQSPLDQF